MPRACLDFRQSIGDAWATIVAAASGRPDVVACPVTNPSAAMLPAPGVGAGIGAISGKANVPGAGVHVRQTIVGHPVATVHAIAVPAVPVAHAAELVARTGATLIHSDMVGSRLNAACSAPVAGLQGDAGGGDDQAGER
ncbi:hypothetical protein D9M72_474770 [compost metagenome]